MVQKLLKQLGFTEKEITIYIAILQKGKIAVSEVAKITGINRTTVYSAAKELVEKGVISEDLGGSTRYLVALPLRDLKLLIGKEERVLEQKRNTIEKAIKGLRALSKDAKYTVPKIVFIDEKNLEKYLYKQSKIWSDSIMERDGTWWGFYDYTYLEQYEKVIDWWYWKEVVPQGLSIKLLTNRSAIEKKMEKKKYAQRKIKFWNGAKKFTASTYVCGDYVIMVVTNQRPHYLVEIHDAVLAHNIREIFKGLWGKIR